jgi:hypothetical protein
MNTQSLLSKIKFVRSEYVSKHTFVHMDGGTCPLPYRNEKCWAPSRHFLMKQSYLGSLPCLFARVKKCKFVLVSSFVRMTSQPSLLLPALKNCLLLTEYYKKKPKETFVVRVVPAPLFVHKYRSHNYGRKMFCLFSRGWDYGSKLLQFMWSNLTYYISNGIN